MNATNASEKLAKALDNCAPLDFDSHFAQSPSSHKEPIMRKLLIPLLLATSLSAHSAEDKWNGPDKPVHFGVSFILGFAAGNQFPDNKPLAFGLAMLPGVLKEVSDRKTTGFSAKDLTFNAAGALLGVYSAHWLITKSGDKINVAYSTTF